MANIDTPDCKSIYHWIVIDIHWRLDNRLISIIFSSLMGDDEDKDTAMKNLKSSMQMMMDSEKLGIVMMKIQIVFLAIQRFVMKSTTTVMEMLMKILQCHTI